MKRAREIALGMIKDYGMGENVVGDEREVAEILNIAYKETQVLYASNKEIIEMAYEIMLKNEVLHKEDIEKIKNEIF